MAGNIIVITGPKHAGKTSAGEALARLGGGLFIDLDALVTSRTGKTPRELFREGPDVFGKAEAESLAAILPEHTGRRDLVVAAGGGLIVNVTAVELLINNRLALGVYLSIPAETAGRRIAAGGELPPFLNTGSPEETHRALHERRAAAYRKMARFTVDCENKSPEESAREIMNGFSKGVR
jgi:shikimate kinase